MIEITVAICGNKPVQLNHDTLQLTLDGATITPDVLSECSDVNITDEQLTILLEYIELLRYIRGMKRLTQTGQLNIRTPLNNQFVSPELTRQYTIWETCLKAKIAELFE